MNNSPIRCGQYDVACGLKYQITIAAIVITLCAISFFAGYYFSEPVIERDVFVHPQLAEYDFSRSEIHRVVNQETGELLFLIIDYKALPEIRDNERIIHAAANEN